MNLGVVRCPDRMNVAVHFQSENHPMERSIGLIDHCLVLVYFLQTCSEASLCWRTHQRDRLVLCVES
jgi:hypothetical protein